MKNLIYACLCVMTVLMVCFNLYASYDKPTQGAYCSTTCPNGADITCYSSPCSAGDNYVECNGVRTYC